MNWFSERESISSVQHNDDLNSAYMPTKKKNTRNKNIFTFTLKRK